MIKDNEPYLIEYNIRLGDPECQVILPRLKTDIVKIFKKANENKLNEVKIEWKKKKHDNCSMLKRLSWVL